MKKITLLTITNNPYYDKTIESIKDISDEIHIKFSKTYFGSYYDVISNIKKLCSKKIYSYPDDDYDAKDDVEIQERLLREIDRSNAELVITLDGGEIFQPSIVQEINEFWKSNKLAMMFNYDKFITDDGRNVHGNIIYPSEPQMKVFKWRKKLTYIPWKGQHKIYNYRKPNDHWKATTKIQSYNCYTKDLEKSFIRWLKDIGEFPK